MSPNPRTISKVLYRSLIEAPVLVGDLPEATIFCHRDLSLPRDLPPLDLRQKLGHLCEDALAILLDGSPRFDLVARNLQLRDDGHTTLGELDFLLRDLDSGQLIHLELATKFYLAVETEAGLALPADARDNYFRKLDRLRSHQLLLPDSYQRYLPEAYRNETIVTQQLIHGCLFDSIRAAELATPQFVQPECRRGRWVSIAELPSYFPPETTFERIPKALWPVPLDLLEQIPLEPWSPAPAIARCVMLRASGECMPYFVTPADYPGAGLCA